MGYELQIDDADAQPLASNEGWGDVITWVRSLPVVAVPNLRHFVEYGWDGDVDAIGKEIDAALKSHPTKAQGVADTLDNWRELLKGADGATVISVTNGIG